MTRQKETSHLAAGDGLAAPESGHTPGPWVLIRCGGRDDSAVATIEPAPETMETPNYWTVASANPLRDEWQANARLIAAAPDLLEAAKEALEELYRVSPSRAAPKLRAAIAKSEAAS
jgi:hypothetical protein